MNLKNKLMITMTMLNKTIISLLLCLGLLSSTVQAADKVTYIHNDALGSPVAATDANGKLLWREDYKPYGERIRKEVASKDNTLWYTGKPHEEDFGLSYFGARWYSPQMGRFTGLDPAGFSEGNVQSFNRYAYANNNPYRYVDPNGHSAILALCAAGPEGCIIGAVVTIYSFVSAVKGTQDALLNENVKSDGEGSTQNDNSSAVQPKQSPDLPKGLVGDQSDQRSGQRGKRHNSGSLLPENGGTGNAETDFDHLTGGTGQADPKTGHIIGDNGVRYRPGKSSEGPRIVIPANGGKPHETLHY